MASKKNKQVFVKLTRLSSEDLKKYSIEVKSPKIPIDTNKKHQNSLTNDVSTKTMRYNLRNRGSRPNCVQKNDDKKSIPSSMYMI